MEREKEENASECNAMQFEMVGFSVILFYFVFMLFCIF